MYVCVCTCVYTCVCTCVLTSVYMCDVYIFFMGVAKTYRPHPSYSMFCNVSDTSSHVEFPYWQVFKYINTSDKGKLLLIA